MSIGQQLFFGDSAYATTRFANAGVPVYLSIGLAGIAVGALALPMSSIVQRLKGSEFAIGMWVASKLAHLLVNLDSLAQGETDTALIELNACSATR